MASRQTTWRRRKKRKLARWTLFVGAACTLSKGRVSLDWLVQGAVLRPVHTLGAPRCAGVTRAGDHASSTRAAPRVPGPAHALSGRTRARLSSRQASRRPSLPRMPWAQHAGERAPPGFVAHKSTTPRAALCLCCWCGAFPPDAPGCRLRCHRDGHTRQANQRGACEADNSAAGAARRAARRLGNRTAAVPAPRCQLHVEASPHSQAV
jgi:hypothetical protein